MSMQDCGDRKKARIDRQFPRAAEKRVSLSIGSTRMEQSEVPSPSARKA